MNAAEINHGTIAPSMDASVPPCEHPECARPGTYRRPMRHGIARLCQRHADQYDDEIGLPDGYEPTGPRRYAAIEAWLRSHPGRHTPEAISAGTGLRLRTVVVDLRLMDAQRRVLGGASGWRIRPAPETTPKPVTGPIRPAGTSPKPDPQSQAGRVYAALEQVQPATSRQVAERMAGGPASTEARSVVSSHLSHLYRQGSVERSRRHRRAPYVYRVQDGAE